MSQAPCYEPGLGGTELQRRDKEKERGLPTSSFEHPASRLAEGEGFARAGGRLPEPPSQATGHTGGGGGIRTPDPTSRIAVFKTAALSRSATPPGASPDRRQYR